MGAHQRTRTPARMPSAPAAATIRSRLNDLAPAVAQINRLTRLAGIADTSAPVVAGKPVIDRIHDLLRSHRDLAFSPAEIMECTHVNENGLEAVRKALQRLCSRQVIRREGHALYRINLPPQEEGAPP